MVIREQHLKVVVIATFDYSCLSNQDYQGALFKLSFYC